MEGALGVHQHQPVAPAPKVDEQLEGPSRGIPCWARRSDECRPRAPEAAPAPGPPRPSARPRPRPPPLGGPRPRSARPRGATCRDRCHDRCPGSWRSTRRCRRPSVVSGRVAGRRAGRIRDTCENERAGVWFPRPPRRVLFCGPLDSTSQGDSAVPALPPWCTKTSMRFDKLRPRIKTLRYSSFVQRRRKYRWTNSQGGTLTRFRSLAHSSFTSSALLLILNVLLGAGRV